MEPVIFLLVGWGISAVLCEEVLVAMWLQIVPPLLLMPVMGDIQCSFQCQNQQPNYRYPQRVLAFLLSSPMSAHATIYASVEDATIYASKISSSHGCQPQSCWCLVLSMSPGHFNETALSGTYFFITILCE